MLKKETLSLSKAGRVVFIITLTALITLAHGAPAQTPDSLSAGTRVRLICPSKGTIIGTVRHWSPDAVEIKVPGQTRTASVPWSAVSAVQVSTKRRSNAGVGALVGFALGTAMAGYAAFCTEYEDPGAGLVFIMGEVVFGLPGTLLGAIVGSLIRTDVWSEVPIAKTRGIGVDMRISRSLGIRFAGDLRAAGYRAGRQHDIRLSAGVVFVMGCH